MKNKYAFTLVEVIIVVAIIALSAAILFPALSRVRENGRRAVCSSNLGQLAKAGLLYAQDYDDHLAPLGTTLPSRVSWTQLIFPYVRHVGLFNCPSDRSVAPVSWATSPVPPGFVSPFHTSYLMNVTSEVEPGQGTALASVQVPSERIYLAEGASVATRDTPFVAIGNSLKFSAWVLDSPSNPLVLDADDVTYAAPYVRHLGTTNVAYADGHVKAVKPESWYYPNSAQMKMTGS